MPVRLHISWQNIDTIVELASRRRQPDREYRTPDGEKVKSIRVLNYDHRQRYEALIAGGELFQKVVAGDPEINLESTGEIITKTYRIYVDSDFCPAFNFTANDVLTRPDGEVERRPHAPPQPNVNETIPLKISEPKFTPIEVARRFVISKSYFIVHTDGVSYRFLYDIARILAEAHQFATISAHDPSTMQKVPLILFRRNPPYPAAFLEGRVQDDAYCLLLHLSRQELKKPLDTGEIREGEDGGNRGEWEAGIE